MLKNLFRKKASSKGGKEESASQDHERQPASSDDAYAEQQIEGARVTRNSGQPTNREPSDSSTQAGAKETLADIVNPRALIAQAVGSHALTIAKTNTVLKIVTLALTVLVVVLGLMARSAWNQDVEYRYFFTSSDGRVYERAPLTAPLLSLNNVRDFYAQSMSHLFSFHYRNFADHYQRLAPDIMTERAMHEFASELDRIGLIKSMEDRREVAEAVILQTPVLSASGEDPNTGVYTWELTVPFNLRLESGRVVRQGVDSVRRMGGVARVQIIRVEPHIHPRQILINRITIRDTAND